MMTDKEKLIAISQEIEKLKEELDDQILLEKYYSGTAPNDKEMLKKQIKTKERVFKISNILKS